MVAGVIVVSRFEVPEAAGAGFHADASAALEVLGRCPGYVEGRLGRNVDDPSLWVLTTSWADIGSYRRALSSYDVKVTAVPLLSRAVDEPAAYEDLTGSVSGANESVPRVLD